MKRGDQTDSKWEELGTGGPNYGSGVNIIFNNGKQPRQGKRTDLDDMYDDAQDGFSLNQLKRKHPKQVSATRTTDVRSPVIV